jgi:hypothetical protein
MTMLLASCRRPGVPGRVPASTVGAVIAAILAVVHPDPAVAGNTRTQTYQPGEPYTGQPGGAPGRTSGRTGTQTPSGLPPAPGGSPATPARLPAPYDRLSYVPPQCLPELQNDWRQFELCLLMEIEHKATRLPDLDSGLIETWGRSNVSYNCYAFAVDRRNPTYWVGPRFNGIPRALDISIRNPQELFDFFTNRGWTPMPYTNAPPPPDEERVVLYARPGGYYEHGAVVTTNGVFAKMGELGVFRFSSVDQMIGPAFGSPTKMFFKRVP